MENLIETLIKGVEAFLPSCTIGINRLRDLSRADGREFEPRPQKASPRLVEQDLLDRKSRQLTSIFVSGIIIAGTGDDLKLFGRDAKDSRGLA
jgi:hypothetical protein